VLGFGPSRIPPVPSFLQKKVYTTSAFRGIDWTSITFSLSGLFALAALYGPRFLDISPVAHHMLLDQMQESLLIFDAQNRLVDFNRAAEQTFSVSQASIGKHVAQVMARWPEVIALIETVQREGKSRSTHGGENAVFDSRTTLLKDARGQSYGSIIVSRDITRRVRAEIGLEQRLAEAKALNQQLEEAQTQIVAQARDLARDEERRRVGRDLHDSVSQSLHSLVLFSETLASIIRKGDTARAQKMIERLQESARQAHQELRLMSYNLQTEAEPLNRDLIADLQERLAMVESRAGIRVAFQADALPPDLPQRWQRQLFWIASEALNNALKHAQAKDVRIVIHCDDAMLKMEIQDDGMGFDPKQTTAGGMGMRTMRERAQAIGGEMRVESRPGKGTRVMVSVPWKKVKDESD